MNSTITTNPVTVTTIPDSTLGQMLQAAIARAEAAEELAASYAETNTVQRRRMEELQAYVNAAVKRAEAAEAQLAAVPDYVAYYVTAWGPFEAAGGEGAEPLEFDAWLQARE